MDLPRPVEVNTEIGAVEDDTPMGQADALIRVEALKMLQSDAHKYPVKAPKDMKKDKKGGSKRKRAALAAAAAETLELFPDEQLEEARALVALEAEEIAAQRGDPDGARFAEAWEAAAQDLVYVPSQRSVVRFAPAQGGEGRGPEVPVRGDPSPGGQAGGQGREGGAAPRAQVRRLRQARRPAAPGAGNGARGGGHGRH
ncbi:unnamed protein product [Heterosigma akashiwo]